MESQPKIIEEVGFEFNWSEPKVWALELPVEELPLSELSWHFDVPFLGEKGEGYNLTPRAVMEQPEEHPEEATRTLAADTVHPIDIMENKGRWLILDGLHRLMKLAIQGKTSVRVRKVPREKIPEILELA